MGYTVTYLHVNCIYKYIHIVRKRAVHTKNYRIYTQHNWDHMPYPRGFVQHLSRQEYYDNRNTVTEIDYKLYFTEPWKAKVNLVGFALLSLSLLVSIPLKQLWIDPNIHQLSVENSEYVMVINHTGHTKLRFLCHLRWIIAVGTIATRVLRCDDNILWIIFCSLSPHLTSGQTKVHIQSPRFCESHDAPSLDHSRK